MFALEYIAKNIIVDTVDIAYLSVIHLASYPMRKAKEDIHDIDDHQARHSSKSLSGLNGVMLATCL